jgi:hypothetical protein
MQIKLIKKFGNNKNESLWGCSLDNFIFKFKEKRVWRQSKIDMKFGLFHFFMEIYIAINRTNCILHFIQRKFLYVMTFLKVFEDIWKLSEKFTAWGGDSKIPKRRPKFKNFVWFLRPLASSQFQVLVSFPGSNTQIMQELPQKKLLSILIFHKNSLHFSRGIHIIKMTS